ncbi:hypothetical protein FKW77_005553 [Venturia effusa]|uniref:Uncharacterized protein n=1 Tax=Venturia effusa TaxID=50376 RepID=A0A517LNZ1_9PEZI|nr:hypothetical protein FKW77_005553 [Venturia effusa]
MALISTGGGRGSSGKDVDAAPLITILDIRVKNEASIARLSSGTKGGEMVVNLAQLLVKLSVIDDDSTQKLVMTAGSVQLFQKAADPTRLGKDGTIGSDSGDSFGTISDSAITVHIHTPRNLLRATHDTRHTGFRFYGSGTRRKAE